jgi:Tol biopolymer transport system component
LVDGSESFLYREQPAFAPSWSADGKWIAFDAGGGNNADIYRVPAAGGAAEKIIASPKADWLPTYSPDGKQICFVSNRSGQFDLWVQNLSTSETTQLTNSVEPELRGAWSHDGQKLAYFQNSAIEFGWRIWIHDFSVKKADEVFYFPQDNRVDILGKIVWKQDDSAIYFTPSWSGAPLLEVSIISKKVNTVFETEIKGMTMRRSAFTIFKESGYFIFQEGAVDIWMADGLK